MLSTSIKKAHDAVFVVTAPSYHERHESVKRELGADNFEFVYGLDKSDTSISELSAKGVYDEARAVALDRFSNPMSLGPICCSIGHNEVYHRMIERGIERALIFEDDAYVLVQDEMRLQKIIAAIPPDADIVYWGWYRLPRRPLYAPFVEWLYNQQHSAGKLKYTPKMIKNLYPRRYNRHFMVSGKKLWSHAYTITLTGAKKILEWNEPVAVPADNAMMFAILNEELKGYASVRKLFGQRSQEPGAIKSLNT